MKKYFIYSAALLALASSCQSDDFLGNNGGNVQTSGNETAINFAGETGKITRADKKEGEAAGLLDNNFVVVGFKNSEPDTKTLVFDHYNVNYKASTAGTTASNTKNWEYVGQDYKIKGLQDKLGSTTTQTIKYWDNSCSSYDFLAFSLGKGYKATTEATATYATPTAVNSNTLSSEAYTLKGNANTLGECYISDIKTVENSTTTSPNGYSNKAVEMSFRHATSKVRIALFENVPGYVINEVKFHADAYSTGAYSEGDTDGKLFGTFNENGTLTVYFPTTGLNKKNEKDYNKAHINFTADTEANGTVSSKSFGNVNYGNELEDAIAKGNTYLSQSAAKPSYCGENSNQYYITVLPAENNSQVATIRIDYTLTATDGSGETIKVKNATATIPAAYTAWKHGYAYTYIFKISPNTNGTTGTPGSDSEGLTAISFDAVVLDDIETGKQETITNTTECSITTYGFMNNNNIVTTNNEEYPAGADIYATAYIPEHSCSVEGEKTKGDFRAPNYLYTVDIDDKAVQEINVSSVLNAFEHGTKDQSANTWTVTDINGKKLIVTKVTTGTEEVQKVPTENGGELTINALKWTGEAGKIYFVEYNTGCKMKAYKIVKVAAAK